MVKQKKVSDMKTCELIDYLYENDEWDDGTYDELVSRPPFDIFLEEKEEMQKKIDKLEKEVYKLQKHSHSNGKVVTPLI